MATLARAGSERTRRLSSCPGGSLVPSAPTSSASGPSSAAVPALAAAPLVPPRRASSSHSLRRPAAQGHARVPDPASRSRHGLRRPAAVPAHSPQATQVPRKVPSLASSSRSMNSSFGSLSLSRKKSYQGPPGMRRNASWGVGAEAPPASSYGLQSSRKRRSSRGSLNNLRRKRGAAVGGGGSGSGGGHNATWP